MTTITGISHDNGRGLYTRPRCSRSVRVCASSASRTSRLANSAHDRPSTNADSGGNLPTAWIATALLRVPVKKQPHSGLGEEAAAEDAAAAAVGTIRIAPALQTQRQRQRRGEAHHSAKADAACPSAGPTEGWAMSEHHDEHNDLHKPPCQDITIATPQVSALPEPLKNWKPFSVLMWDADTVLQTYDEMLELEEHLGNRKFGERPPDICDAQLGEYLEVRIPRCQRLLQDLDPPDFYEDEDDDDGPTLKQEVISARLAYVSLQAELSKPQDEDVSLPLLIAHIWDAKLSYCAAIVARSRKSKDLKKTVCGRSLKCWKCSTNTNSDGTTENRRCTISERAQIACERK
jgi:hypothetical protein